MHTSYAAKQNFVHTFLYSPHSSYKKLEHCAGNIFYFIHIHYAELNIMLYNIFYSMHTNCSKLSYIVYNHFIIMHTIYAELTFIMYYIFHILSSKHKYYAELHKIHGIYIFSSLSILVIYLYGSIFHLMKYILLLYNVNTVSHYCYSPIVLLIDIYKFLHIWTDIFIYPISLLYHHTEQIFISHYINFYLYIIRRDLISIYSEIIIYCLYITTFDSSKSFCDYTVLTFLGSIFVLTDI